jgi:transposase-like protein
MEETLQHQTTTQCIGLPPTCARSHRAHGSKAYHALTFIMDHSSGAAQEQAAEIKRSKRELARVTEERNILKKGVAFVRHWSEGNGRAHT